MSDLERDLKDALEELSSLVDNSLVVQEEGPDGAPRFIMLETIRAYAWERLVESGELTELKMKHAAYYLAIVDSTKGLLFAKAETRNRGLAEAGNLQAALQWLLQQG